MSPTLPRWLTHAARDALRLTKAGDLRGATAAIRAALAGTRPGADPAPAPRAPAAGMAGAGVPTAMVVDIDARVVDAPPPPTASRSTGGHFTAGSHSAAGLVRAYKLFVPAGGADGPPRPLVVMLHGCTQDPDDFAAGTGMNEAAQAQGVVVLYPAQDASANPARCWNWFKHNHQVRDHGEPALLASLTRAVMAQQAIDPQRVYVAGLSAGGAMADILGRTYPELFAAVGVHSGLPAGAARDVASAFAAMKGGAFTAAAGRASPPTIVFHGDGDGTVHPRNGEQVVAASAGTAQPHSQRARSANGRDYTRSQYQDREGRTVAEHWSVHGSGHAWSGGRVAGSYTDAQGPDATAEMLRFFREHPHAGPQGSG